MKKQSVDAVVTTIRMSVGSLLACWNDTEACSTSMSISAESVVEGSDISDRKVIRDMQIEV